MRVHLICLDNEIQERIQLREKKLYSKETKQALFDSSSIEFDGILILGYVLSIYN